MEEDSRIIDLYLKRDQSAITLTAEKYGGRLKAVAKQITGDAFMADECENDTYMEAWQSIPPNEPRTYFFPYLTRIVRHIVLNRCEKENAKKRQGNLSELTEEMQECISSGEDLEGRVVDELMLSKSINGFLASLDEDKRNIFVRRYYFMDDIKGLSQRTGYSESKLKSMLMRMREKLKERLEKDGIDF